MGILSDGKSFPKRILLFFVLALFLPSFLIPEQAHSSDLPVPLPAKLERPSASAGPTIIAIGVWIGDILKIDGVAQTFEANIFLTMRWRDTRLAHSGPSTVSYRLEDIWHPAWIIMNKAAPIDRSLPEVAEVAPDGSVVYRQSLLGAFSQKLNLRAFPFDQDKFQVHLVLTEFSPAEIQFVPDQKWASAGISNGVGLAQSMTIQDWRITAASAEPLPYLIEPSIQLPGYVIEFRASRVSRHFIIKVIIPLLLVVFMSWAVFWVDPSQVSSQISVAITAMLTLIAYRFSVDGDIPKLPYLTRLDAFILASSLLVFLSLIEVLVVTNLGQNGQIELARRVDRRSRIIFPLIFLICTVIILI